MKNRLFTKPRLFVLLSLCASCLAVFFIATIKPSIISAQATSGTLSQLSEEECIDFIVENGVEIPGEFVDSPELGVYVKGIIQAVEADPNCSFDYINYAVAFDFAESIKTLVNDYYGIQQGGQGYSFAAQSAYILQDNWVEDGNGNWVDSGGYWNSSLFGYYNCYAYAIERTENPHTYPTLRQYQPGDFAGTGSFTPSISVYNLALIVKDDLEFLGYSVSVTSSVPVTLDPYDKLICIRRANNSPYDYHFMKYNTADGYWYHKPGFTAILKINTILPIKFGVPSIVWKVLKV
jgi:hypothetical protein